MGTPRAQGKVPYLSYAALRTWTLDDVRDALAGLPDGGPVDLNGLGRFRRGRFCSCTRAPAGPP